MFLPILAAWALLYCKWKNRGGAKIIHGIDTALFRQSIDGDERDTKQ